MAQQINQMALYNARFGEVERKIEKLVKVVSVCLERLDILRDAVIGLAQTMNGGPVEGEPVIGLQLVTKDAVEQESGQGTDVPTGTKEKEGIEVVELPNLQDQNYSFSSGDGTTKSRSDT